MEYEVKSGTENMQYSHVTELLTNSYWCKGIGLEEVILQACHSTYVVGAFVDTKQVGYARVISDTYRFAYIMDVIVEESFRGQGLGSAMIEHILHCKELKFVYQWLLITKDAHNFYRKNGFQKLSRQDDWLEIRNPRPER